MAVRVIYMGGRLGNCRQTALDMIDDGGSLLNYVMYTRVTVRYFWRLTAC